IPYDAPAPRNPRHGNAALYNPGRQYRVRPEELQFQTELLEGLCNTIIADAEIEPADIMEKENFRAMIEEVARSAISHYEREQNGLQDFPPSSVQLKCFGSLSSGFATKAADMDLGLLSPFSGMQPSDPNSPVPRLVEKAFLNIGLGARLLTRTRVPIIKICERPPERLRLDLLDERAKWERGITEEVEEGDTHEEHDTTSVEEIQPHDYRQHKHRQESLELRQEGLGQKALNPEQKFRSLRQGQNQSLQSYANSAKALLRKLGGRDLAHSNATDFGTDDFEFLNEFSLAFVDGLADQKLRERLFQYKSLSRYDVMTGRNHRTLHGVNIQVEGEAMAMIWENRQILEKDEHHELQAQKCITMWQNLQNKPGYGFDPLKYNKELQIAEDQLKRIPSIHVMLLSQFQHEPATVYHSRAASVLFELGGHDIPSEDNTVLAIVLRQYIRGIMGDEIRQQVESFASSHDHITLRAVARRHKSLQLAHEYEKCLEKGLYLAESADNIKAYIDLLRGPMIPSSSPDSEFDFVVPVTPDSAPVLSAIRLLSDPSKMAPNQPRDPYRDRLEFPKSGVGVQCDINFSAHLALHNTMLLRCYAHSDPRVRPLVLFIKHWAKVRQINSPYRGTLSSYGYVLMMLHYLVNVAQPFVCPNLQQLAPPLDPSLTPQQIEEMTTCKGRNVQFWRDEAEIKRLAHGNALNQNRDSIGYLLRGFFEYYAQNNFMSTGQGRGFDWGRDVLSLRTYGGLLTKQEKGWTGAKTVIVVKPTAAAPVSTISPDHSQDATAGGQQQLVSPGLEASGPAITGNAPQAQPQPVGHAVREVKEVRHRYLFAIEDPFELDHNVARTVTHNGIVAIRDEFRRAWRIIKSAGKGAGQEELLQDAGMADVWRERGQFSQLLGELHGGDILPGGSGL
ncbi:hypothetical protein B0T17DRAFT_481994, partial [Bombardia bombarda]